MRKNLFGRVVGTGSIAGILISSSLSSAYEIDTHFYATYAMARYAGIKHDVAKVIASAAQWPDETELLGSPLISDLGLGTKMRRLFHFPCKPSTIQSGGQSLNTVSGGSIQSLANRLVQLTPGTGDSVQMIKDYIGSLNAVCMTQPADEDPMPYNMLYEGLLEGNLIKAATSIHTIEDSYAHAGTPSNVGHAAFGHIPDRPFTSPAKYRRMVRSVMTALVAIRMNLPESALNKDFHDPHAKTRTKNYKMTIDQLASNYRDNPFVQKTYREDQFRNPEFIQPALVYLLKKGQRITSGGDYFIDPTFDVESWLGSQQDIQAEIKRGAKDQKAPDFINRLLVKIIPRLMEVKTPKDIPVLDSGRALGLIKDFPKLNQDESTINESIKRLSVERAELPVPSRFTTDAKFNNMSAETLRRMVEIDLELSRLRELRRKNYSAQFDQDLAQNSRDYNVDQNRVIYEVVQLLTAGFIPIPLGQEHRMEFEFEGPLRLREAALRIRNIRQTIYELFGDYVEFVESSKIWSYPASRPRVQNLPIHLLNPTPDQLVEDDTLLPLAGEYERRPGTLDTNIKYVTFNYNQIDIWVETMLRYTFPLLSEDLFPQDKCTITSEITKIVNGKSVRLEPALKVEGKNEVFSSFIKILWSPGDVGCNPNFPSGSKLHPIDRIVEKQMALVLDFMTTHVKPGVELDAFTNEAGDKGLQTFFGKFHPDRTPLVRPFLAWGELTAEQEAQLNSDLRRRVGLVYSGHQDDTPYLGITEFKDSNH